jgi:hypothetical protein
MLRMLRCDCYPKDNENQLGTNEVHFISNIFSVQPSLVLLRVSRVCNYLIDLARDVT